MAPSFRELSWLSSTRYAGFSEHNTSGSMPPQCSERQSAAQALHGVRRTGFLEPGNRRHISVEAGIGDVADRQRFRGPAEQRGNTARR